MKRLLLLLVVAVLATFTLLQSRKQNVRQHELETLGASLGVLEADIADAVPSAGQSHGDISLDIDELKGRAQRVYQLRGDVTMAKLELEKLTSRTKELAAQIRVRIIESEATASPTFPPGYKPRHELVNRGRETPEAAVETFFWSLVYGDTAVFKSVSVSKAPGPDILSIPSLGDGLPLSEHFQKFPGYLSISVESEPSGFMKTVTIKTAPTAHPIRLTVVGRTNQWVVLLEERDPFPMSFK